MIKKLMVYGSVLCVSAIALLATAQTEQSGPPAPPPARKIPGITAEDPYRHACVDCHLNYVEMNLDTRFSTLLHHWSEQVDPKLLAKAQASAPAGMTLQGKHPDATSSLTDIPAKCLVCHGKGSKIAPPFVGMIHNIHLTGGEENHFLTMFQGECTYCHKIDLATGHWTIPSAPEK